MAAKSSSRTDRMVWFHEARFGMFIHWGLYSLLQRGEWAMYLERIPTNEYATLADEFKPKKFDADSWAGIAAESGVKYVALTTRHHDGFCLFDSQISDFTAPKTAAKRDFVEEYVEACRRAGLKVGLYYSLIDWRFPGCYDQVKHKKSAAAMVEQAHEQVRELMSNYGRIDLLWYDGGCVMNRPKGFHAGRFWKASALNAMVRRLQPEIIINGRSGTPEDFDTPEQHVTPSKAGRVWESCMTVGDTWGYSASENNAKPVSRLVQDLVRAAKFSGNYLLNVGPKPNGTIRGSERKRLLQVGQWLKENGESIYGSERAFTAEPAGTVGEWTQKGNSGYIHVFRWPGKKLTVSGIGTKVNRVTMLATNEEFEFELEDGRLTISGLPKKPMNEFDTVLEVEFEGKPKEHKPRNKAAWLEA